MGMRIVYPRGMTAEEYERLQDSLQVLKRVPRVEKQERLKVSLPSAMSEEERKQALNDVLGAMQSAREEVVFDTVVEETSQSDVEETVADIRDRLGGRRSD